MWKPPQRIKYSADGGRWPSAEEAGRSRLFSPLKRGRLMLSQRTWVPAMVPWRATEDGDVTDDILDWYRRFAQGRPGAIVVEATGIRDVASGPLLRIGHDRYLPGLEKLTQVVRDASGGETRLFIQLIDFLTIRRRPDRTKFLQRFLTLTDEIREAVGAPGLAEDEVRRRLCELDEDGLQAVLSPRDFESLTRGYRERVTDMHIDAIRRLPETLPGLFAAAARRAEAAGFDGVELHYAHAYTMASFLSALNTRGDGYGGTREERVRLPLEVFAAVRDGVGEQFVCGCRMLSEDCIDGGSGVDDASFFAQRFARAGMDFISLSRGGKFEDAKTPRVGQAIYPYTGRSGYECMPAYISDEFGPFERNVEPGERIRDGVRRAGLDTPIVIAGGIHSFDQAERILDSGKADVIALARQSLADPDWFAKVKGGHGEQVNLCEYTNYCEGLDAKHKMVTCQLWDRTDKDRPGVKLTPDGKRRTTAPAWKPT
ncbi:MAG: NADH:flavin oxidoreductase [Pseudomonadota bacterium]